MLSVLKFVIAALGIAVLMVVHEGGHYLVARYYGMRVTRFSIGFGPTLWRHRPKGSETTFQIAVIPFLAYVQIAGMNPFEEEEEDDTGSYAKAGLVARIATIAAGPAANYFFASILLFSGFALGGKTRDDHSMKVHVSEKGPAAVAGMKDFDKIVSIGGEPVDNWTSLVAAVKSRAGQTIPVGVERDGQSMVIPVVPGAPGSEFPGKILISPELRPVKGWGEAVTLSVTEPPRVVYELVAGLVRVITGREKAELSGPVGIVRETAKAVDSGAADTFMLLGMLSAYLGGFNLLPIPALDGGRLIFLSFEALSKRKSDAKMEAKVHAVGLLLMMSLVAVVTWTEIFPKH